MSTPAGPHSRARLAAALAAMAAAAAPATAAEARPLAPNRIDRGGVAQRPQAPVAAVRTETSFSAQVSGTPVGYEAPAITPSPVEDDGTVAYHPDAVSDLELVRVTTGSGGAARVAIDASHDGVLRVKWSGGGQSGSEWHPVRAGQQQVRLRGARNVSHLRLRISLQPNGDLASASASGTFKLRR